MRKFRDKQPQRLYNGQPKKYYGDYRDELRKDFNGRCGYTDTLDVRWGDGFHVDHFAPKKPDIEDPEKFQKFVSRENLYTNLIYACPQVNRAKGNDWPSDDPDVSAVGEKGYLDPCDIDFNDYFERTDAGGIVPKDHPIALYMWKKLRLYLKRYELYWRIEQLEERLDKLIDIKNDLELPSSIENDVKNGIVELTEEYRRYGKYLSVNYLKIVR